MLADINLVFKQVTQLCVMLNVTSNCADLQELLQPNQHLIFKELTEGSV